MVGACVMGYRKAGRGEGKRLGLREVGFDAGEGCGSRVERHSGAFFKPLVTWETVGMGPG